MKKNRKGGARVAIPKEIKDRAIALYESGLGPRRISHQLPIAETTVCNLLKERGIKKRPQKIYNRLPDYIREQAIDLYVNEEKTFPEVARIMGLGITTVARWITQEGKQRGMSKAFALAIQKGNKKGYRSFNIPWQSQKTGKWEFADSRWEVVRMQQLDEDDSVAYWSRLTDRVPYIDAQGKNHTYAPDFFIQYKDGRRAIEEVKPKNKINDKGNAEKFSAAVSHFSKKGMGFSIVTEDNIGLNNIRKLKIDGLMEPSENERIAHKKRRRNAHLRTLREKARAEKKGNTKKPAQKAA